MQFKKSLLAIAVMTALGNAFAAEAPSTPDASGPAESATFDTISVIGQGETRQVQRIVPADVETLPPGTSPLKVLDILPGVHFESADPFGNYEWSTRISLRGFNQNRIGFTLDGIPLGDMSYGNNNGVHISRALISENLGQIELAQFVNKSGLQAIGDNLFLETPASGTPQNGTPSLDGFGDLQQNNLEQANVEPVKEISDLIAAQRAYEMNAKVITATDQMLQSTSQMLR